MLNDLLVPESEFLLEHQGYELVRRIGLVVPRAKLIRSVEEVATLDLHAFPGTRVVVKVVSPEILHKTEVGGVRIVARDREYVEGAVRDMQRRLSHEELVGFLICEFVDHEQSPGCELLLSARWTEDFGPVVFLGWGGAAAEYFSGSLRQGHDLAVLTPEFDSYADVQSAMEGKVIASLITGDVRGIRSRLSMPDLVSLLQRFLHFAARSFPHPYHELEINPLVLTERGPVALDVICRRSGAGTKKASYPERPLWKLRRLLEPRTIAILGVSEKMNAGRRMLRNILSAGFAADGIRVIKPGREEIDGCRCYPDIASIPPTDLVILGIDAGQVPTAIEEMVTRDRAESILLISGGVGERPGTQALEQEVRGMLAESRNTPGQGPLLNGGNCLGIRSVPGRYNTLFVPPYKIRRPGDSASSIPAPLAILSQSGAFLGTVASRLGPIDPRYMISCGNQTDLTVGDYLAYLKEDPNLEIFACYIEGFRPGDGLPWARAARRIADSSRTVLLYRAGRTPAGAAATRTHTAAIAGDYAVTREIAQQSGALVVDSLADFNDMLRLLVLLRTKRVDGFRLAAFSNAGFECVAMADNLGQFRFATPGLETKKVLQRILERLRLQNVVDTGNPFDGTPIFDDAGYEEAVRAWMHDSGVDVGIVGVVPLTGALSTLARGDWHTEDFLREDSVAMRLARLHRESHKAWVMVIDGGSLYDPMAAAVENLGVPVFRSMDRALRLLNLYCRHRMQ